MTSLTLVSSSSLLPRHNAACVPVGADEVDQSTVVSWVQNDRLLVSTEVLDA